MKPKIDTEPIAQFDPQLIDELLAGHSTSQVIQGLIDQLTKTVLERALSGELTHHLGYEKHAKEKTGNQRNGTARKTLKTKQGGGKSPFPATARPPSRRSLSPNTKRGGKVLTN